MKNYTRLPKKISNLIFLKKKFLVPNFIFYQYGKYEKNKENILKIISKKFKNVIIRSAFSEEDKEGFTNAGKFLSIQNLKSNDKKNLDLAIRRVINSYKVKKTKNQYFIIQEMVKNIIQSGVIFAKNEVNGVPEVKINFSNFNETDSITSGKNNGKIIYYIYKNKSNFRKEKKLNKINKNIKILLNYINPLDLEFCVDKKQNLFLLQIRKLKSPKNKFNKLKYINSFNNFEKKLNKLLTTTMPTINGKFTIFSTMPDWNPAEIIGIKPHNLALNLYKILITDDIWSKSRSELGYKNIENTPLMYDFLGTPYIDLRADLNSFIPKNLDEKDSEKLVNFYLNKYKKNPEFFFDKIESELVISSFDFSIDDKIKKIGNILNKNSKIKLKNEIKNLTLGIIKNIGNDIEKYQKLNIHLSSLNKKKLYSFNKIQELIKIGKSYGTLPFANLARSGFVAVALINSMVNKKIINTEIKEKFLQSIPSITKEMNNELIKLSKKDFLKKYGHLRPNTYDIMSDNYKVGYKKYFDFKNLRPIIIKNYKFDKKIITSISKHLKKHQFPIKVKKLLNFIKLSIEHRERAKLEFSKIIDLIFYEIDKISKRFNIKKEDKKFIDIFDIIKLYSEFKDYNIKKFIQKKIKKNKHDYEFNNSIELPNNILDGKDIFFYEEKINSPTFITKSVVTYKIIFLNDKNLNKNLNNKIICIKNADPGFDFIFTKKIRGLITVYGGPNSHMSIRCTELNIPAAIGIGPQIYETIKASKKIMLDTAQKKITQI